MANLMSVKEYDLTEITKILLRIRDNCIRKDSDVYDDTEREAKYAALNEAITLINNPSLLKPVRHGRWVPTSDENKKRCSVCDIIHLIAQYPHGQANYCPNCGAKMDLEVQHE